MKAEQIAATGAKIVATPCENCRLQLDLLNQRYNLGIQVSAVTDLLVQAAVVEEGQKKKKAVALLTPNPLLFHLLPILTPIPTLQPLTSNF